MNPILKCFDKLAISLFGGFFTLVLLGLSIFGGIILLRIIIENPLSPFSLCFYLLIVSLVISLTSAHLKNLKKLRYDELSPKEYVDNLIKRKNNK